VRIRRTGNCRLAKLLRESVESRRRVRSAALAVSWIGLALAMLAGGPGQLSAAESGLAPSPTAERVYAAVQPSLLQIRTLVAAAGRQSSIGSGFIIGADGLALTNYHVVSQYAFEPATYRLEYTATDGARGQLALLAIDVANDLAVVRLDRGDRPFLAFDDQAVHGALPKGERLYAMGNPLDLGFTIVEGTYNGTVERSYAERIHFTGAINPGMSGGPTVTADGRIAGVNVAKQFGSDLVSFLVPARFAAALFERAGADALTTPEAIRAEIGRQLTAWQSTLYRSVGEVGFRSATLGPYRAPESEAPWFSCWAQTNQGQEPRPRATVNTTNCRSDTRLFVANDLSTGFIQLSHSHVSSIDLNAFQFAAFLSQQSQPIWSGVNRKWYTPQRCHEDFLGLAPTAAHPPMRTQWCARAYRKFEGLYDVWLTAVTQDSVSQALVSRFSLQGVDYDTAVALGRRFLEAVQWAK